MSSLIAHYLADFSYTITNCFSCFPSSPNLKINNRSFKIQRLLGEGGFSYVYLVLDPSTSETYALKKIRCPFGQESVSQALKEVEAYALFSPHPNIIPAIDHSIASDRGGSDPGAKTVYILLPYYRRGNLQDIINANLVNHTRFPERRLMVLLRGVCRALKALHQYKVKQPGNGGGDSGPVKAAKRVRKEAARADAEAEEEAELEVEFSANSSRRRRKEEMRAEPGGGTKAAEEEEGREAEPLMENEITAAQEGVEPGQVRAYAHRDIKPSNIMIADDGHTAILMDMGSLAPSPTPITSRSQAIAVQDQAAEHSTMPYRAPELFDVKTDAVLDTKVDIWSLGCTIYACLVGRSPFEARSEETGGSLTMCVLGGDWRFLDEGSASAVGGGGKGKTKAREADPRYGRQDSGVSEGAEGGGDKHGISEPVRELVRRCLRVEPSERPDVDELTRMVEDVIAELPEGGDDS